jgi:hypothetical protein
VPVKVVAAGLAAPAEVEEKIGVASDFPIIWLEF